MTENRAELFNPTGALQEYLDLLADLPPEEGAKAADLFAKEIARVWVSEFAAVRRAHVRELRRMHSEKEVAEILGITPARVWQIVEG